MSPNLTAALLEERRKKLTPVEVPEADLTIHVRELSFKEGRDYSHAVTLLDTSDVDQRNVFMANIASSIITDPETFKPVFSDANPIDALPLRVYNAVVLAAVAAAGMFGTSSASAVDSGAGEVPLEATVAVLGESSNPTTLPGPSTDKPEVLASVIDSFTDSPLNSESTT